MTTKTYLVECHADNAPRFKDWLTSRGGIAVWQSLDLRHAGATCSTPALTPEGEPTGKPGWQWANKPARIVTKAHDVGVYREALFKAVRVSLGRSGKLTDASQRKIDRLLAQCREKHKTASYQLGTLTDAPASIGVFYVTSLEPLL